MTEAKIMIGATLKLVRAGVLPPMCVAVVEELADAILGWE